MATVETKEIGISFGVDKGSYNKTEVVNGSLKLKKVSGSESIFEKQGYWESEVIDIAGKFKEYDKLAVTKTQFTDDLYKVETRTSDDNIAFNDYIAISVGGSILSPKKRYIQIRINLYAGYVNENVKVSEFNNVLETDKWADSSMVDTDTGLKLKKDFVYNMTPDNTWTNEGSLLRQPIKKTKFKQINTLGME